MGNLGESGLETARTTSIGARAGWHARLELSFERRSGITVLAERSHRGPLVVQRPFYPEADVCHVYVIHPPGGIVAGDEITLSARVRSNARALITTPAAGKFYRSEGATARLVQDFLVEGGMFEWLPQENIFYPEARAHVHARVRLSGGARFLGWEVSCFGLAARAEPFLAGELLQRLELWLDNELVLCERQRVDWECIAARWGLAGNAALGTLLAYPADSCDLEMARAAAQTDANVSCTVFDRVMVCRAVAPRADRLRQAFIAIWSALRPLIMGRAAVAPRIWAT